LFGISTITAQALNFLRQIIPGLAAIENRNLMSFLKQRLDDRRTEVTCTADDE
jgi:hypothetical protein